MATGEAEVRAAIPRSSRIVLEVEVEEEAFLKLAFDMKMERRSREIGDDEDDALTHLLTLGTRDR